MIQSYSYSNVIIYSSLFFEYKSEFVYRSAWNRAHKPNRESPRVRVALCSTRRHFINNRPIRAKLREKLPHCLRNKKP